MSISPELRLKLGVLEIEIVSSALIFDRELDSTVSTDYKIRTACCFDSVVFNIFVEIFEESEESTSDSTVYDIRFIISSEVRRQCELFGERIVLDPRNDDCREKSSKTLAEKIDLIQGDLPTAEGSLLTCYLKADE